MRKTTKFLALTLTLLLALTAMTPVAFAADPTYYPGVSIASGSSSNAFISSVTPSAIKIYDDRATQDVSVEYYSTYASQWYLGYYTSATIRLTLVGYKDNAVDSGKPDIFVDGKPSNVQTSISNSVLSITYNPYTQGTTPFSITLVGNDGEYKNMQTTLTINPSNVGSSSAPNYYNQQLYNQFAYNMYNIDLSKPSVMYAGDVYTLSATLTHPYNVSNPYYYDNYWNYGYDGDLYVYYDNGYYPYSSARLQVYTNSGWSALLYGNTVYTLSELNAKGITPKLYWSAVGYGSVLYPYGYNPASSGVNTTTKVTFTTDVPSSVVKIGQVTDQSANFQALEPGTYVLTLSVPNGYSLINGDNATNVSNWYTYYNYNGIYGVYDPSNPFAYYQGMMAYASTKKTYTITVLPKPGTTTSTVVPTTPITPTTPTTAPGRSAEVLKNGVQVYNAAGTVIGTIDKSSITIYEAVGNRYRFSFQGGDGYIAKSIINVKG